MGYIIIFAVIGLLIFGAAKIGVFEKIMPGLKSTPSQNMDKANIQKVSIPDKASSAVNVQMPGTTIYTSSKPTTVMVAAWNAQLGWMFANGGITTTEGSLMAKYGVSQTFEWNDDYGVMQKALLAHAKACSRGDYFSGEGKTFVAFMGDGATSFLQAINPQLKKELGPEYIAEGIDVAGFSYGEDKWLGPPDWKRNPQSARGSLTICVLRDGDFNICLKWASDNNIPVNPDPTTYDPNALNFYPANSFSHAAQLFIAGVTEERPVVKDGKRTGEKRTITAQGVSTWLPGDQLVVDQRGGVITIASTFDYAGQMPCLIVGIKKFDQMNPEIIEGMIRAISDGAETVRASDKARWKGAEVSAAVYQQNTPEYWYKYFGGQPRTVTVDGQSYVVTLGGSRVCTISDVLLYYGMAPGSRNIFKDTYDFFGHQYMKLYPEYMPAYPPFEEVMNTTYLNKVRNEIGATTAPTIAKFQAGSEITQVVGRKGYSVEFASGSAELTGRGIATLEQIAADYSMAFEMKLSFIGHTDSDGDEYYNQKLSENRAAACRDWLYRKYPVNFPVSRMNIEGRGETQPIADNNTVAGKAKNRRVEIIVGR